MSAPASKPALLTLPLELLSQIVQIPNETRGAAGWPRGWLPISTANKPRENRMEIPDEEFEPIRSIRALSQTCKSLRSLTLPLLWATVSVDTIEELGRLRQTLRVSSALAAHIRTFYFSWYPDWFNYGSYMIRDETRRRTQPLDLAFADRWQLWSDLASRLGAEVQYSVDTRARAFFVHKGKKYTAPGKPKLIEGRDPKQTSSYDWSATWDGDVSGPDGNGEDRLIKTAIEFNECIVEIFGRLSSQLNNFDWSSPLAPMPWAAFDVLAKLSTIKRFHARLLMHNGDVHSLPFWNAVSRVEVLSLELHGYMCSTAELAEEDEACANDTSSPEGGTVDGGGGSGLGIDEQQAVDVETHDSQEQPEADEQQGEVEPETDEESDAGLDETSSQSSDWNSWELIETFIEFEPPEVAPKHLRNSAELMARIAARTIIAAARGGRLRHLQLEGDQPHAFELRSAVPLWVNLEILEVEEDTYELSDFTQAATLLRPFLAHASLWFDTYLNTGARHIVISRRSKFRLC